MKLTSRIIAAAAAMALSAAACGCENKQPQKASSEMATEATESVTAEKTTAATTVATSAEKKTETATTSVTNSVPASETAVTDTKKADEAPKKGFDSPFAAAQAYYSAYITGNADAVYDMFCEDEIRCYNAYLNTTELLEGKNAQTVFKRSNVISAIQQSIGSIRSIMAEKSDVPPDKWTVSLTEDILKNIDENELGDYNKTLGTSFAAASDCGHVYYSDGNNDHSFIGNGCAFVCLDERWYLAYATVLNAELITYMNIL